jgi:hypothetical protein
MSTADGTAASSARGPEPVGRAALIASVGGQRGWADWANPEHRLRRLLAEFIGMSGLTFVLSGSAAILVRYGGHPLQPWQTVLVLSLVSALRLVVAVYFLGDISATSTRLPRWPSRCAATGAGSWPAPTGSSSSSPPPADRC